MKIVLALLALLSPVSAYAAAGVSLDSKVLVERIETTPDGQSVTTREEPGVVTPGDRLVFVLSYRNNGNEPASGFVLTNPIPKAVAFAGTDDSSAVVSVDGGETWGQLASLTVAGSEGVSRPAQVDDVTHIRWVFTHVVPSGAEGELSFRGVVE